MPRSHGPTRPPGSIIRCAKSGPNTTGPQIAPDTAPKSTKDMPRARRSGGNISAAAARESSTIAPAAPTSARPRQTRNADTAEQPTATVRADRAEHEAAADDRHRPLRSISRPAGPTAIAPEREEDRGAEPEDPLDARDRDERQRAERRCELEHARVANERAGEQHAFRRTSALTARVYAARPRRTRPRRRATDDERTARRAPPRRAARLRPHDGRASPRRGTAAPRDLGACRAAIRRRRTGMRRHDVPEQHVVRDAEIVEHALHDRRARLGGPAPVSWRSDVKAMPLMRAPR